MRDKTLTNVLLISKGWYKQLYKNELEALNAYYHKYYGCEDNPNCEYMSWKKPVEMSDKNLK